MQVCMSLFWEVTLCPSQLAKEVSVPTYCPNIINNVTIFHSQNIPVWLANYITIPHFSHILYEIRILKPNFNNFI